MGFNITLLVDQLICCPLDDCPINIGHCFTETVLYKGNGCLSMASNVSAVFLKYPDLSQQTIKVWKYVRCEICGHVVQGTVNVYCRRPPTFFC